MMNFQSFKERITLLDVVYSIRDKTPYKICSVQGNLLTVQRASTGNDANIKLDELYDFYISENEYSTKNAREYISGYVYSPAVAIIRNLVE